MRRSPSATLVAVVAALVVLASACGSDGEDAQPAVRPEVPTTDGGAPVSGGTLVDLQNFATSGDPDHIDPALATTVQSAQPGHLLWDGLTETDYRTGELRPMVAERWDSNGDATVWTFKLRPGVTFSNGDPVQPSDFKYAWERVVTRSMASSLSYHLTDNARIKGARAMLEGTGTELTGVRADDANLSLTVELEAPLGIFPTVVSHLVFSPMNRRTVSQLPDQAAYEQGIMIGNGPYRLAEPWKHGRSITLVRNDTYWGGLNGHKAYIDRIEFQISRDVSSAYTQFESGQAQTAYIPPGRYGEARARYGTNISDRPVLGVYYWAFNMRDPVVGGADNVKLRQAIALAIDRQAIVDTLYRGTRKVATGFTPPGVPGHREGLSELVRRDLDRARRVLGEWERETDRDASRLEPIKLNFSSGGGHDSVATLIQANLRDLGIESSLDARDPTTYVTQMRRGEGQFLRSGWFWDYAAYDNGLFPVFDSRAIGGDNLALYENPKFDAAIDEARRQREPGAAIPIYQGAERTVLDQDVVVVPLNWYTGQVVYAGELRNVVQGALGFFAYDEMWLAK
ncbi:MAG TPA: ABC transporter substrate-binding protein [Acidimicrobiales bacterium]|jgi:oligopeptide transport system substrate-binding protein|nr:ABC transporter substrate-binding protein [Acidimicrobiales bacterium]